MAHPPPARGRPRRCVRRPLAPTSGPRGPPLPRRCDGGTLASSLRPPPAPRTGVPVSSTRGAGTWRQCGRRRPARRCGCRPAMARWSVGTPPDYWHLRPRRRLTLFEGETAAGRPQAVVVGWLGSVWDSDPARQPLPPRPRSLVDPAGGGRRGALPPPLAQRRLVGRPAGAGRGLGHCPMATRPPPRSPRLASGPPAREVARVADRRAEG